MTSSIWDSGVAGPPGPDGKPAIMRISGNQLQWSVQGTNIWYNLLPLSDITGPPGPSVQGPIGPQGVPGQTVVGPAGPAGTVIYSGSTPPSDVIGVDGDFYVDLASAFFYGPKTAGTWGPATIDLRGGASGVNFGQRSITNNSALIAKLAATDPTLATNSDYTQVTGIFDAIGTGINRGITQQANSITIARAGFYEVALWASMSFSVNNCNTAFKFAVNGTIASTRRPIVRLDVANNIGALSASGFFTLAAGDVLTVYVATTVAGNLRIIDAVFSALEMR